MKEDNSKHRKESKPTETEEKKTEEEFGIQMSDMLDEEDDSLHNPLL